MKREILNIFKQLHRTRQHVFENDPRALTEGRKEINKNFRKYKYLTDKDEIKKLVQIAEDVEKELRTNVIQAVKKDDHVYELRIREETTKLDNIPFSLMAPKPEKSR